MKKSNNGYVLIYVVFVIIFLCIVAIGTCTVALNNIKIQTAYIEQLQNRYEAEGSLEQFMAEVCVAASGLSQDGYADASVAKAAAQTAFANVVTAKKQDNTALSAARWDAANQYILTAEAESGQSRAVAEIDFSVNIAVDGYDKVIGKDDEGNDIKELRFKYHIAGATSKYLSYNLESTGGGAE